jgi:hypothetical protein
METRFVRILFAGMQKGEGSNSVLQEGQWIFLTLAAEDLYLPEKVMDIIQRKEEMGG